MEQEKKPYQVVATPLLLDGERAEPGDIVELTDKEAAALGDHISGGQCRRRLQTTKKGVKHEDRATRLTTSSPLRGPEPAALRRLTGAVCAAGAKALGIAETATDIGEQAPVNTHGILLVEAGAAIAAGAEVESDANGKAITKAAGISNGFALDAAAAAGDVIRIIRGI
jgi:hypothetical protein